MRPVILTIIAFAFCGACAADKTVTNKELGFEITFPQTWDVTEKPVDSLIVYGFSPKAAKAEISAAVNVNVCDRKGFDLDSFVLAGLAADAKELKNYELIEKIETKISDKRAYRLIHCYDTLLEKTRRKLMRYVLFVESRCFVITAETLKVEWDLYDKDIAEVVRSFKLLNQESKP